jgi:hypothetical protein
MQYKGKSIVDIPSAGTKYVPIIVHTVNEQKDMAITDIVVAAGSLYTQIGDGIYLWKEVEGSVVVPYLSFIEENNEPFTLGTFAGCKNWDGTLYYSTDTENWAEWDGTEISSSNDGKLYVRGKGNTKIGGDTSCSWVLSPNKRIQCFGNIENLLDYEVVEQGNHPVMAEQCYRDMFEDCTSLVQAPELHATTLTESCYEEMFWGCESLVQAPELPATTLAESCYSGMFSHCTSLTGQIHCASSTSSSGYRLTTSDISGSATIVFDL